MFKIMVRQISDGSYYQLKDVPAHITNAEHIRTVKRYVEQSRPSAARCGYKVERV